MQNRPIYCIFLLKRFIIITLLCIAFKQQIVAQAYQYTTTADGTKRFDKTILRFANTISKQPLERVQVNFNVARKFQKMEGFGYALTGGSAKLIQELPIEKKQVLMREIFGKGENDLGISYIRISIGASDLDATVFSYCDLPDGKTDSTLQHFSIAADSAYLIPTIKNALTLNPDLKIMASPWSPPTWMKSNGSSKGGHLLKKYYATYAHYFVKYIQAMQRNGIKINAITVQNEPEHGGNNPSMLMDAQEQTEFIRDYLGPQFRAAKLTTEIVIWDHNADHPIYPITVLNDAKAKSYIAASAFHLYLGDEKALSEVHTAHPDKKLYFTEQWTGAKGDFDGDLMWHLEHIVIGTIRNWSSLVLEWNLAANAKYEPYTPGGCTECKGAFTIQDNMVTRNVSYYIIGQISKFVPRGSVLVETTSNDATVKSIGFLLPNGKHALLLLNTSAEKRVQLEVGGKNIELNMPTKSASTIVW